MTIQHAKEWARKQGQEWVRQKEYNLAHIYVAIESFCEELERPAEGEVKPDVFRDMKIAQYTQSELDEAVKKAQEEMYSQEALDYEIKRVVKEVIEPLEKNNQWLPTDEMSNYNAIRRALTKAREIFGGEE